MKLPDDSIGISDILAYRDCPERFAFGMRRHTAEGEAPEAHSPATAYGSAIHLAIELVEAEVLSDEKAIQEAIKGFFRYLDPDDIERLRADLATYHERDEVGVQTVAVERECRVPLMAYEGRTIYFRFKLDRLYQRLDNPGVFIHRDYKSSKYRKSQKEVHEDLQMWAYNFGIHEFWPECENLIQIYDQLAYGEVPTRKSDAQRASIKDWLVKQATTILEDDDLEPSLNEWCPWCPLVASCPEPRRSAEFTVARIAALAPRDEETGKLDLDPDLMETYVGELERATQARKALEEFEKAVKAVLLDLPLAKRTYLGYETFEKGRDKWSPQAIRLVHEKLGDEAFYGLISMTKTALKGYLGDDKDTYEDILALATRELQAPQVKKLSE